MTVQLYQGDCLEILPTLPGPADAIITDLPYGTTACQWDTVIPFAPMWEQVKRLLKRRGAFVTTAGQPFTSALIMSNLSWFKYTMAWDKVTHANFLRAKIEPLEVHEDIIVFGDAGLIYNPQMHDGAMRLFSQPAGKSKSDHHPDMPYLDRGGKGYPKSIIRFPRPNNLSGGGLHPTQKPVPLYEYLIRTYTNAGDTVLDFCMGSGTTGVACVKTGRNFIGIELDAAYFAIAERRIAEAQAQGVLL